MKADELSAPGAPAQPGTFTRTHWSVVLTVADADPVRRAEALEQVCRTYWEPLYVYVRHRGYEAHDAQDLTQSFFAFLLGKNLIETADPERGRFRSFLLGCMKHFLAKHDARAHAEKRGGGKAIMPLDAEVAEKHYHEDSSGDLTALQQFDRRWALTVLDHAFARLNGEALAAGKAERFEALQPFLSAEGGEASYEQAARRLKTTPGAARQEVLRLRCRLRKLVRAEIAHTVRDPGDVEAEMHYLVGLLSR